MIVVTIVVRRSAGANSSAMLGRFSVPAAFFSLPDRRLRQERPDEDQRDRRDDAGHQRVAPGRVRFVDRTPKRRARQVRRIRRRTGRWHRDQQPADRRERLRVAEHFLALLRFGEQLRQPRDRGDELDAHADEDEAAQAPAASGSRSTKPARNAETA